MFLGRRNLYYLRKFTMKTLKQGTRVFDNAARISLSFTKSYSTDFSDIIDKEITRKYFNFIQLNKDYLGSICIPDSKNFKEVYDLLQKKEKIENELNDLNTMHYDGDREMEKMIVEEKEMFNSNIRNIENEILQNILQNDTNAKNVNTEIQIIPAVGGHEAKLFAAELFNMYINYASYKNWDCLMSTFGGEISELRTGHILLLGIDSYNHLINEAGVHRVQRVPATEKSGRIHTSTCSVVVLPTEEIGPVVVKDKDITIETLRSSGPGGQNVNKLETCVRIKHIPTGIVVESQESRYQYENKKLALEKLKNNLYATEINKKMLERKTTKKEQIGTNDYSDKIRTYNFIQNRVTDHRINCTVHNLYGFLMGNKELDQMICSVKKFRRKQFLLNHMEKTLQSNEYKAFKKKQSAKT